MVYTDIVERVGVRELKQNASRVVSDVERHGPVVVTVNGRDAVVMAPLPGRHRWVPAEEALRFWESLDKDPDWTEELEQQRDADLLQDPWDRT
jgi:antitoxin (DNA-binding transcriptional repressor) of toxin-antitoxin stability system